MLWCVLFNADRPHPAPSYVQRFCIRDRLRCVSRSFGRVPKFVAAIPPLAVSPLGYCVTSDCKWNGLKRPRVRGRRAPGERAGQALAAVAAVAAAGTWLRRFHEAGEVRAGRAAAPPGVCGQCPTETFPPPEWVTRLKEENDPSNLPEIFEPR